MVIPARLSSTRRAAANDFNSPPASTILRSVDGLYAWLVSPSGGRWGEKVPAAGRAVSLGLVVLEGSTGGGDRPFLGDQRTGLPTVGTGLLLAEFASLLLGGRFECAGEQSANGGHRDLLHLVEVDVDPRPVFAPVLLDDDLAPPPGEFGDPLQILGCRFACGHVPSRHRVPPPSPREILSRPTRTGLAATK